MRMFIAKLFVVCMALVAIELPCYVDQYRMHLEGHLEESRDTMIKLEQHAKAAGFPVVKNYILLFKNDPKVEIQNHGNFLDQIVARNQKLEEWYKRFTERSPLLHPLIFFISYDPQIASEAWHSFSPGLLLGGASLLWGGIVALLSTVIIFFVRRRKA
jgi:hypothetical protein